MNNPSLLLGIDIGTTSLSAQVVDAASGLCVQTCNFPHRAAMSIDGYPDAYAADANFLVKSSLELITSLCDQFPAISAIGITGQMHGIVCIDQAGEILSPLYTWQNQFGQRIANGTLTIAEEITTLTGAMIPTGYGIATYYALNKLGLLPPSTATIVTIMDLLGAKLCKTQPMLHPTNAAALGGYDLEVGEFQADVLDKLGIPPQILPPVVGDYTIAGHYVLSPQRTIPVAVAIGDNQAALLGSLADDHGILVNIGTGSQISLICASADGHSGELRPYFDGKYIRSGAALCGGSAFAILKNFIASILKEFGTNTEDEAVYEYLCRIAEKGSDDPLTVDTRFAGTRKDPAWRGSVTGIGMNNFTPSALSAGILEGIIDELNEMYSVMSDTPPSRIVASGNAIRKNPILRKICGERFGNAPIVPLHTEEAAYGAALYAGISAGLFTRKQSYSRIHYHTSKEV